MRIVFLVASFLMAGTAAAAAKPIRFWNLTTKTVTSVQLAKPGTQAFGADFCKADKDGSVDYDERLNMPSAIPGHYDVKIGYADGRSCVVKNLNLEAGKVFSIEDKDLTACTK